MALFLLLMLTYYTETTFGDYDSLYGMMTVYGDYRQCQVFQTNFKSDTLDIKSRKLKASIKYDSSGKKVELIIFDIDGSNHESRDIYIYNKNKLTKIINYYVDQSKPGTVRKFEYDSLGQQTREIILWRDSTILDDKIITYVRTENQLEKTTTGSSYDDGTEIIKYDKFGKKIESSFNTSLSHGKFVCEYNDKNKLIKEVLYSWGTDITGTHSLQYDNNGNCIFESYITPNEYYIHKLWYDEAGNVTKILNLNKDSKPRFILEFVYSK